MDKLVSFSLCEKNQDLIPIILHAPPEYVQQEFDLIDQAQTLVIIQGNRKKIRAPRHKISPVIGHMLNATSSNNAFQWMGYDWLVSIDGLRFAPPILRLLDMNGEYRVHLRTGCSKMYEVEESSTPEHSRPRSTGVVARDNSAGQRNRTQCACALSGERQGWRDSLRDMRFWRAGRTRYRSTACSVSAARPW